MAKAEYEKVVAVDAKKMFETIIQYERYPEFVDGCTRTHVERMPAKDGEAQSKVQYFVSLIKDIDYTLLHHEFADQGKITWELVSSSFLKKNTGAWTIESRGPGQCFVKHEIEIEFNIPVPGLILNRLIKSSLPGMVSNFEKQAKKS